VNNALKHSGARKIEIQLTTGHGAVRLRVTDFGQGFPDSAGKGKGIGMAALNYRANLIGGTLNISSWPGEGVTVECVVFLQKLIVNANTSIKPNENDDPANLLRLLG